MTGWGKLAKGGGARARTSLLALGTVAALACCAVPCLSHADSLSCQAGDAAVTSAATESTDGTDGANAAGSSATPASAIPVGFADLRSTDGMVPQGAQLEATLGALAVNEQFSAQVAHTSPEGVADTIACGFRITGENTCMVSGAGIKGGYTAIDRATRGRVDIPQTVDYEGATYTVTAVGPYAFGSTSSVACDALAQVALPATVESVGSYAFSYCESLASVNFPSALRAIGERAFNYCTSLQAAQLPVGLATIDKYAFYFCERLETLVVPAGVTSIGIYAFCQCNGLSSVIFDGDCPTVGISAFTGNTTIASVVFRGSSMASTSSRFNSDSVAQPTFYYTVRFYSTKADALAGSGLLGTATISDDTKYLRISSSLATAGSIYEGAVPAYPDGTNVWRFEAGVARHATIGASQYAWAEAATCFDLAGGAVRATSCQYRGEAATLYSEAPQVFDGEGTRLDENVDYRMTYRRQNAQGAWEATSDTTSPGTVQAVATGMAPYAGEATTTFDIRLEKGCTFVAQVPTSVDGAGATTRCAFTVTSLENGTGTLAVAAKINNKAEADAEVVPFAVAQGYSGGLAIPETLELFGNTFSVTDIASNAFGGAKQSSRISEVDIPATVTSFGADAFANCTGLRKVVFRGNLDTATFGNYVFNGSTNMATVVFYGKRPDDSRYSLEKMFPGGNVAFYYTITFYESKEAVGTVAPLGSVTIRDTFLLGCIPDKPTSPSIVYDGAVPSYPASLIDDTSNPDRSWYAPSWVYPEANADSDRALRSTLSNSVYAYAEQRQDAFTVDDAIVLGIEESYDYTGANAFEAPSVKVISPLGGTLSLNRDYTLSFELYDDWDEVWGPVEATIAPGRYRAVVRGMGKYASQTRSQAIEFSVVTHELLPGDTFSTPLSLVAPGGRETTILCTFGVLTAGEGRTVCVQGTSLQPAVSAYGAEGEITIPSTVEHLGLAYEVSALSDYAFAGCSKLTGINLPQSLASVGQWAFARCSKVASLDIPGSVTTIPAYAFEDCAGLTLLALHEGTVEMEHHACSGASSLAGLTLPSTLATIGQGAFEGCLALRSLALPYGLESYAGAFKGSSVAEVAFGEGTTSIPDEAFADVASLQVATLPSTLASIGTNAFVRTGLTSIVLPQAVERLGQSAFGMCTALAAVVFEGDPNAIEADESFASSRAIRHVVYRSKGLVDPAEMFTSLASGVSYYSTVAFYASEADLASGVAAGTAAVRHGTRLSEIAAASTAQAGGDPQGSQDLVFDGAIPAIPAPSAAWRFSGDALPSDTVDGAMHAVAYACDLTDLATAAVLTAGGYKYRSSTINPITDGTASVVRADGTVLARGVHYTVTFQRQNAEGQWADTLNLASVGQLRITATAMEGSGYTGAAVGYYAITNYAVGDAFEAADENGHAITYQVLVVPTAAQRGEVQVGANGQQAVAEDAAGAVVIPEEVRDPAGNAYAPVTIGARAFYRRMGVTSMSVPSTVSLIYQQAFAFELRKTDTKTSNLATVIFNNDMEATRLGKDVFLGCDVLGTVVYGQKAGTWESRNPLALRPGMTLTRYYTTRYYETAEDAAARRNVMATVVLREGSYIEQPSATDYHAGSDTVPELGRGWAWLYESTAVDAEGTLRDSQAAVRQEVEDNVITGTVAHRTAAVEDQIACAFTIVRNGSSSERGEVVVGCLQDGTPAIAAQTDGTVAIPETVSAQGVTYDVVGVGAYAFGASEATQACVALYGVELPASVKAIDQAAFMNCTSLGRVAGLEASALSAVGPAAFANCTALSAVSLPEGLSAIQGSAFANSGLQRIVLPSTLATLGKRAFDGCARLADVTFAGAWAIDAPPLEGQPIEASAEPRAPAAGTASGLSVLDDYVFANCPQLRRMTFELDARGIAVSGVAFEGSTALQTLVFAGSKADFSPTGLAPRTCVTVNYFAEATAVGTADRMGYLCLTEGTVPSERAEESVYAGAVPTLEDHYEWVYATDPAAPLLDSSSAYRQKISYLLDTSASDAALAVSCFVGGQAAQTATYGDVVQVAVAGKAAVQVAGFTVTNALTQEVVHASSEAAGSFVMPAAPVRIVATGSMDLTLSVMKATGQAPEPVVVSMDDMCQLCAAQQDVARYSAWQPSHESLVAASGTAVGIRSLLASCGMRFDAGDTLVLESAQDGTSVFVTYDELFGETRFYYPGIAEGEVEGAVETEPALCISSASATGEQASADATVLQQESMMGCYQFCFGQTPREFAKMRETSSRWIGRVSSITVLYGAEDVANCQITGVDASYAYTGDAIEPAVVVTDIDGNVMAPGTDYDVSYENNTEAGVATVLVRGRGLYAGTQEVTFGIRRARVLAGNSAPATAAAIALAAYPNGSDGAIVATADNFPDALAASALSAALNMPILLSRGETLMPAVADALAALSAGRSEFSILVMGSGAAVPDSVYDQMAPYATGENYLMRLAGNDRYDTARLIYEYGSMLDLWGDTVIVVTGRNYPDALSIAPYAAWSRSPILLCDGTSLDEGTHALIGAGGFARALVPGSTDAVGGGVSGVLEGLFGAQNVVRFSGTNRYDTCQIVARWSIAQGMSADGAAVAIGEKFPDGLAGAALLGKSASVLLLASETNRTTYDVLRDNKGEVNRLYFFGDTAVVSESMQAEALSCLGWGPEMLR